MLTNFLKNDLISRVSPFLIKTNKSLYDDGDPIPYIQLTLAMIMTSFLLEREAVDLILNLSIFCWWLGSLF